MGKDFLYWFFFMLLILSWFFGGYTFWDGNRRFAIGFGFAGVCMVILLFIIGLAMFGQPIK